MINIFFLAFYVCEYISVRTGSYCGAFIALVVDRCSLLFAIIEGR